MVCGKFSNAARCVVLEVALIGEEGAQRFQRQVQGFPFFSACKEGGHDLRRVLGRRRFGERGRGRQDRITNGESPPRVAVRFLESGVTALPTLTRFRSFIMVAIGFPLTHQLVALWVEPILHHFPLLSLLS